MQRRLSKRACVLVLAALAALACGAREQLPASGFACVESAGFSLWGPSHQVEVEFDGCIPGCANPKPKCEVIVDGSEIVIDAWINVDEATACGGSCRTPVATCDWPEGLVGEFEIEFGQSRVTRTLDDHPDFCIGAD